MTEIIDLEVCVDCVMAIANGDYTQLDLSDDADSIKVKIQSGLIWWGNNGYNLIVNAGDQHFSTTPCGVCQTSLSGDRYSVAAVSKANIESEQ